MSEEVDLDAIRKRADHATPGPWKLFPWKPEPGFKGAVVAFDPLPPCLNACAIYGLPEAINKNADFIMHARTDVPALLDEITRLRLFNAAKDKALRDLLAFIGSASAYELDRASQSEAYQNAAKALSNTTER